MVHRLIHVITAPNYSAAFSVSEQVLVLVHHVHDPVAVVHGACTYTQVIHAAHMNAVQFLLVHRREWAARISGQCDLIAVAVDVLGISAVAYDAADNGEGALTQAICIKTTFDLAPGK